MRDLGGALGPARDMDVLIDEALVPMAGRVPLAGADVFHRAAERYRASAYEAVCAMLDSEAYREFKRDFPVWCEARPWEQPPLDAKCAEQLRMPVEVFARGLLNRQTRGVLEQGEGIDPENGVALHLLRIECKKLRYALEFFARLFAGTDDALVHLKSLQDLLGVMHDVSVTVNLLDGIVAEREPREKRDKRDKRDEIEMLLYAGALVGWRRREYHDMCDTFAYRWHNFATAEWPWHD